MRLGGPRSIQLAVKAPVLRRGGHRRGLCALLLAHGRVFALNPALDVSQYVHTAWKIRDGFTKGTISAIAQTPDGYLWLGTGVRPAALRWRRGTVPWQPPPNQRLPSDEIVSLLAAATGRCGLGRAKVSPAGRTGSSSTTQSSAGSYIGRLARRSGRHDLDRPGCVNRMDAHARFRRRASRATVRTGVLATDAVRIVRGPAGQPLGRNGRPVCGDGSRARQRSIRLPTEANGIQGLREDERWRAAD